MYISNTIATHFCRFFQEQTQMSVECVCLWAVHFIDVEKFFQTNLSVIFSFIYLCMRHFENILVCFHFSSTHYCRQFQNCLYFLFENWKLIVAYRCKFYIWNFSSQKIREKSRRKVRKECNHSINIDEVQLISHVGSRRLDDWCKDHSARKE